MSEMHKQNIFNDERCGNVDDDGEDEWVNEQFDRIWKELEPRTKRTRRISADWTLSCGLRVACIYTRLLAFGVSHFSLHKVYR